MNGTKWPAKRKKKKTNKRKNNGLKKIYVAIVVAFVIAGLGVGIKTMQKVQAFNEYEAKLAAAAHTSEQMVLDAVARGHKREDEIIQQANQQARAMLEKANADIQQEKKKALNDAKDEISGMAIAIAEKVVGRELNAADQAQLVDNFINELGDQV